MRPSVCCHCFRRKERRNSPNCSRTMRRLRTLWWTGPKKAALDQKIVGRQKRLEAKIVIADVRDGKLDKSDALCMLVETNRGPDIVMFLAAMADLDEPIVSNALYQTNDEPISLLCKSIGITSGAFGKLMGLKADKLNKSLAETGRTVAFYKDLDVSSAQRAMRFVSMRKNMGTTKAG